MAELKYAKNIITSYPFQHPVKEGRPTLNHILGMGDEVLKGACTVHCAWLGIGPNPGIQEIHVHPHDEVIGFVGTNPDDPHDLGAEAEFWLGGEQYIIRNSFLMFVPAGVKHCPLIVRDVKRPIFHFTMAGDGKYKAYWGMEKLPE